jgi:hypothetical protein
MESTVRNVRDIKSSERLVLEHVLGRQLKENQQVIIQVVDVGMERSDQRDEAAPNQLPDWSKVYAGLTDDQIAEVEEVILRRADLTGVSE